MSIENLKTVLQSIAKPGKLISFEEHPLTLEDGNFFISTLNHVILRYEDDGIEKTKHLMVKLTNWLSKAGRTVSMDKTFFNEITFYQKFSCKFKRCIPKFYCGKLDDLGGTHYMVVEYLVGYKLYPDMRFLPNDHVEYACRELGIFHGLGYIAKAQDPNFEIECRKFKEVRYSKDAMDGLNYDAFFKRTNILSKKAFKFLPAKEKYDKKVLQKYENLLQDTGCFTAELIKPSNNLAVLCHGDYIRNNILFQYNELNQIKSMKMIDFQTVRWAQPGTEIALIFLLNLKAKDLEKNYENFLNIYHEALVETIKDELELEEFKFEQFMEDYAKHCWIGYAAVLFYHSLLDDPLKFSEEQLLDLLNYSDEECELIVAEFGTDETFVNIGRILKHCIDINEKLLDK